ncbi:hypothetical protein GCM10022393_32880 [Aquimarina addita]|uniref:Oxidoreductase n=2 Tax=Aquimarina addita TaxID=870485 RepID=A0ABP6UPY7_9FLAO
MISKYHFSDVIIEPILEDSINIRAIEVDTDFMMYAGSEGKYGYYKIKKGFQFEKRNIENISYEDKVPNYRAIASNATNFFILSVESPALLYMINKKSGKATLVYKEDHEKVFYDSMIFWNDKEGIAMGDPTDTCLSIISTRDGGESWNKISCDDLPETKEGEAAFAASNSNIAVVGDKTWMISGGMKSRVFYSPNKGKTWKVFETPLTQGTSTTGGYSIDFYDEKNGVIYGGDYTKPEMNDKNKAITTDGGITWHLVASGSGAGYKSCVRYIPNSKNQGMIAVGSSGISVSHNNGTSWKNISDTGFYTIRFLSDTIAIAAGKNRIAKITFIK